MNLLEKQTLIAFDRSIEYAETEYILEKYNINVLVIPLNESEGGKPHLMKNIQNLLAYALKTLEKKKLGEKAKRLAEGYKKAIGKWLNKKQKISAPRYFYIVVMCISLYGGVSLYKDAYNYIKDIKGQIESYCETTDDTDEQYLDMSDKSDDFINTLSSKIDTPYEYYQNNPDVEPVASEECIDYIKSKEMCVLYPYYATQAEKAKGKITIGVGHVITGNEDPKILAAIKKLEKEGKITCMWVKNKSGQYVKNPNHARDVISQAYADKLFQNDLKIAQDRVKKSLDMLSNIDDNVKYYVLYNKDIFNAMTSLCFNAGTLKPSKYRYMQSLEKCRFDTENNTINASDWAVTAPKFKIHYSNKALTDRRVEEFNLFGLADANQTFAMN